MYYDYVVVGGGVAGGEASIRIRDALGGRIALISSTPFVYSRMTLSYALRLGVKSISPYVIYTPEEFHEKGVVFIYDEAIEIDTSRRVIKLRSGGYVEYDRLILATGSKANIPEIEGRDLERVYVFQTFDDAVSLEEVAEPGKRALVVGLGMIGLLVSDALSRRGVKIYAVDVLPYPGMTVFEEPLARVMLERLRRRGVEFRGGVSVERLEGSGSVEKAILTNGERVEIDFVIFSTGVSANTPAGLEKLERGVGGSIVTDSFFRSSEKEVYAIGDCASTIDYQTKKIVYRPLGIIASYAAKLLPKTIQGLSYDGFLAYQVEEAFDAIFIRLGLNSFEAKRLGVNLSYAYAEYKAPGIGLKKDLVLFEKGSDKIIGWQSVSSNLPSYKSKIFENLIRFGARIQDLEEKRIRIKEIV